MASRTTRVERTSEEMPAYRASMERVGSGGASSTFVEGFSKGSLFELGLASWSGVLAMFIDFAKTFRGLG